MECRCISEHLYFKRRVNCMATKNHTIQVFEWETLRVGNRDFTQRHYDSLREWQYGQPDRYFREGHKQITFTQWVGVIQVGALVIEVLPKADPNRYSAFTKEREESVKKWKGVLIEMLRKTGRLKVRTSENTDLSVRHQSLFDLYFQYYLDEVEQLIHQGLVKKYRRVEKTRTALKGKLLFQKQVACNTVHKERFYTDAAEYDALNDWNEILFAALKATGRSAQSGLLRARAQNLSLHFPDWSERYFDAAAFDRLHYDRKTTGYKQAITLARLILLQLNPQIASGQERVVALLFDMNRLWEEWLLATYRSAYRHDSTVQVLGKEKQRFWESDHGNKVVETDILIKRGEQHIILDAKWKTPGPLPSDDELKQMFAYNLRWQSQEAWLVYPQVNGDHPRRGAFAIGAAGYLGMEFVDIFENNRLRQSVSLPVISGIFPNALYCAEGRLPPVTISESCPRAIQSFASTAAATARSHSL